MIANIGNNAMSKASENPSKFSSMNDWFLALPPERQAILREDKWMLAEAAFAAGREQSVREAEKSSEPSNI